MDPNKIERSLKRSALIHKNRPGWEVRFTSLSMMTKHGSGCTLYLSVKTKLKQLNKILFGLAKKLLVSLPESTRNQIEKVEFETRLLLTSLCNSNNNPNNNNVLKHLQNPAEKTTNT